MRQVLIDPKLSNGMRMSAGCTCVASSEGIVVELLTAASLALRARARQGDGVERVETLVLGVERR